MRSRSRGRSGPTRHRADAASAGTGPDAVTSRPFSRCPAAQIRSASPAIAIAAPIARLRGVGRASQNAAIAAAKPSAHAVAREPSSEPPVTRGPPVRGAGIASRCWIAAVTSATVTPSETPRLRCRTRACSGSCSSRTATGSNPPRSTVRCGRVGRAVRAHGRRPDGRRDVQRPGVARDHQRRRAARARPGRRRSSAAPSRPRPPRPRRRPLPAAPPRAPTSTQAAQAADVAQELPPARRSAPPASACSATPRRD